MNTMKFISKSFLVLSMLLTLPLNSFAQSPAEREQQRQVPRTPGNWPGVYDISNEVDVLRRPFTASWSGVTDKLVSAYCKTTDIYAKPDGNYLRYQSNYQTCIEPTIHDSSPLALPALNFEDLCHAAAFAHNPQSYPETTITGWTFGCTLEKFTDTELSVSILVRYKYENPNGACYNDPSAICAYDTTLNARTRCLLAAAEPSPQWECFQDGAKAVGYAQRRTESLPLLDNPVPIDATSQQVLLGLVRAHIRARL
ncbi:MAG: hypothetical protein NTX25_00350 [Proteobacteria bacterium]|nr:hypothetical protein [Pseudomonadota bacterium]